MRQTLLVGEELDAKLQQYLKRVRLEGGPVNSRLVVAAIRGILLAYDKSRLQEFGGYIKLSKLIFFYTK